MRVGRVAGMVAAAWAVARAVEVTVKWVLWNAKKSVEGSE